MPLELESLNRLPVRAQMLQHLRPLLLDPRRCLQGFSFGRAPRERSRTVLSVLVEARRRREELGPFDVFFPSGGPFPDVGIPELAGVPTQVQSVGRLDAQQLVGAPQFHGTYGELRSRTRPAFSGASIGHERARAVGTAGALLRDRRSGKAYVLSNNHVLALGTGLRHGVPVPSGGSEAGDLVLQPGLEPLRVSIAGDRFGTLAYHVPLRYVRELQGDADADVNLTDAALAEIPLPDTNLDTNIPYIGPGGSPALPRGIVRGLQTGQLVKKVGRTSGLTFGRIIHGGALVRLSYPEGMVVLDGQIITTHMSVPGDSGSLVLTEANEAAGLLVGGSDFISIFTPLPRILRLFREQHGLELELLRRA